MTNSGSRSLCGGTVSEALAEGVAAHTTRLDAAVDEWRVRCNRAYGETAVRAFVGRLFLT